MIEFDWKMLSSSVLISAFFTSTIGIWLKSNFDRKLEKQKHQLEITKTNLNAEHQRNIELLKSNVLQMNEMKKKNLEHFQSVSQISQQKRVEHLERMWELYIDVRAAVSPIVSFYGVFLPSEYLDAYKNRKEKLNLKSLEKITVPRNYDSFAELIEIEKIRPFLGDELYYKMRSAYCVVMRIAVKFQTEFDDNTIYFWNKDELLRSHIEICLDDKFPDYQMFMENENNPSILQIVLGAIERELNRLMGEVISGERSSNMSMEKTHSLLKNAFDIRK
ncbi:hypothetical protein [Paenibacillus spongiae]|uniref:Uncharacterized protein n=1 Tax=Paenibacillus spongiae TaxID=2909671 RepID=A0ABY5SDM2_9BACL|nr:hypothetical protein [Paenibacillus spongiae]UVI32062.1 hypothetical protein L1F29_09695 [Paenibacillus spongiae]